MTTTILYFSGTGNCLWVARTIAAELGDARVMSISRALAVGIEEDASKTGLVFPVYWGGMPAIVLRSLRLLTHLIESYVFGVATHAGGPGKVLSQLRAELNRIGHELSAGFTLLMPSNYIIGFPAPTRRSVQSTLKNAESTVSGIVDSIKKGVTRRNTTDFPAYRGTDAEYAHFIEGVGESDHGFSVDDSCTGCGICAGVCSVRNIEMCDGRPVWLHHCEQCLGCINWCPARAIQYGKNTSSRGRYTNPHISADDMGVGVQAELQY